MLGLGPPVGYVHAMPCRFITFRFEGSDASHAVTDLTGTWTVKWTQWLRRSQSMVKSIQYMCMFHRSVRVFQSFGLGILRMWTGRFTGSSGHSIHILRRSSEEDHDGVPRKNSQPIVKTFLHTTHSGHHFFAQDGTWHEIRMYSMFSNHRIRQPSATSVFPLRNQTNHRQQRAQKPADTRSGFGDLRRPGAHLEAKPGVGLRRCLGAQRDGLGHPAPEKRKRWTHDLVEDALQVIHGGWLD